MDRIFEIRVSKQVNVFAGPRAGTCFDFSSACPTCGTGAQAVGPRFVKPGKLLANSICLSLDGVMFVSAALGQSLLAVMPSASLAEVRASGSGVKLPYFELRPGATLPRVAASSRGLVREHPCRHCGRDGYFATVNEPIVLHYESSVLISIAAPVMATWECFGNSRLVATLSESTFAAPLLLVGERVAECLSGTPGGCLTPVVLEEG